MKEGLFRKEFLDAKVRADFGEVFLPPQRAVRIAATSSLVVIALLVGMLAWLPYTRIETGVGFVVSDADAFAVTSAFKQRIRIDSVLVRSGEAVVPGKPMLVVGVEAEKADLNNESLSNSLALVTDMAAITGDASKRPIATLVSTQRGYVDKFLVLPGDYVAPGQPILVLRRDKGRIVFRVLADSRSIGFLREGRKVFIRVEAYPFQRFGTVRGHIIGISESSLSPYQAATMFGIQPPSQSRFLVDVAVDDPGAIGGTQALKPGMSAFIDFPLEEMSVLRWIFASLLRTGDRDGR